jgi:hypothetical protein
MTDMGSMRKRFAAASLTAATALTVVLTAFPVHAQASGENRGVQAPKLTAPLIGPATLRELTSARSRHVRWPLQTASSNVAIAKVHASSGGQASRARTSTVARRVLGGAIGATAGFFGGGFLGAAIEGDRCDCDDPGFVGFWIGAPTGAAVGGILGATLLYKVF